MDGDAGWWTTSGNVGLPPLARVMGVGRQQQQALDELTEYIINNSMRANPDKTQATVFPLRNREALKVSWDGVDLENTAHPKFLDVTLNRTLSYKRHIQNTKIKVTTRNNLLRKLANSKWGTNEGTICTAALAMCYSINMLLQYGRDLYMQI